MAFFKNVLGNILNKGNPAPGRSGESFSFDLPVQVDIAFECVVMPQFAGAGTGVLHAVS